MMKKRYTITNLSLISGLLFLLIFASCKKNNNKGGGNTPVTATPTTLGVYAVDSAIYKVLLMNISGIGTQSVNYDLVYDTGSGGLVLDASGVLPASMISSGGFTFSGDSTVVDGITITNQTNIVEYGDDANTTDKVYGNLAYADVKIGDINGNITVKHLPFFLYYKAIDSKGNKLPAHDFDVFGVSQEYDITFSNNAFITTPFQYFDPGTGLTKGFKMAAVPQSSYSYQGTYVPAISLGLTSDDLSSNGFTMSQLNFYQGEGYVPIIQATINYNGKSFQSGVLFDTGTEPYNYIEDPTGPATATLLGNGVSVSTTLNSGFNYSFTTSATDYLSYVENPTNSGSNTTVMGLEFFLTNEYLLDFTNHKMGLKKD
ncbi:MAG: hypothetical protein JSU01_15185 [Bacteroidetes bacterium]|nr:hypothetical protein [Bacteroidota bacterium]